MNQNMKKNAGATLALLVLFSIALVSLPMQRAMAVDTVITSISPNSGFVGTQVIVSGTINTSDGFFTVRWNQTLNVTTGLRAVGSNATTSFVVPPTVGAITGRNVTIELIDDATSTVASVNFTLYTKFDMHVTTPPAPKQLQEGTITTMSVNVTGGAYNTIYTANITVKDPANRTQSAIASISNTTSIGSGESVKTYPFVGVGMNYTGTYTVTSNVTGATETKFFVGLTDKTEYLRSETVHVQAGGYRASEPVMVDIKYGISSVSGFPANLTANFVGVMSLSWGIPLNATPGNYSISVSKATSGGTVKNPGDIQSFEVFGVACSVQTLNLGGEGVAEVSVEVYNATAPIVLLVKGNTSSTGLVRFNLETGNYTFKAFFKNVQVGSLLNISVTQDLTLDLLLSLVNVVATAETEGGFSFPQLRVPFIDIGLEYNYTARDSKNYTETVFIETNTSGVAEAKNLFINTTYNVEAKLYGALFNRTTLTIGAAPISPVNIDFSLPTYTLNVHALDSKSNNAGGVRVDVYEWSSGVTSPFESSNIGNSGDASFLLPFGRYILTASSGEVFLNTTVVNLFENPLTFTFNLITVNLDVTVSVSDFFGQPIANANVTIERKTSDGYAFAYSQFTGADGSTTFVSKLGGDSRISVYVAGGLVAVKTQFLGAGSNQVTIRTGEYVAILGYPVDSGLFTLFSFILVLIICVLVLMRGRIAKALAKRLKS